MFTSFRWTGLFLLLNFRICSNIKAATVDLGKARAPVPIAGKVMEPFFFFSASLRHFFMMSLIVCQK